MKFQIRQKLKMLLQHVILPVLYGIFRHRPIRPGSILFADAHHEELPFSMRRMYELARSRERQGSCRTELFICDFGRMGAGSLVKFLIRFMRQYATAEYVFVCDYFLPVASCKKRPETTVVQLWHSCGLMKKIAWDAPEDIPKGYRGELFANYSYLTVSAGSCVPVHVRALHLAPEKVAATGVSRTDFYFDRAWNAARRQAFYEKYPQAKGRKIVLWAPTFRGNAAQAYLEGLEEVRAAAEELKKDWYFIFKAHPHVDAQGQVSNCTILTEELLPAADVLVTDYSSILFDYLLYRKGAVLFAPDLEEYEQRRGFYLPYRSIPFPLARTKEELVRAIEQSEAWYEAHREQIDRFRETYMGECDGHATGRIWELTGCAKKYGGGVSSQTAED